METTPYLHFLLEAVLLLPLVFQAYSFTSTIAGYFTARCLSELIGDKGTSVFVTKSTLQSIDPKIVVEGGKQDKSFSRSVTIVIVAEGYALPLPLLFLGLEVAISAFI